MKSTTLRRLGAALVAPALAAGLVLAAPSAQAVDNGPQAAAAAWLADQPTIDGLFVSYYGPTRADSFTDYGLNLDLYTALRTLGDDAHADKVYDAVVGSGNTYVDQDGTGPSAGAIGKLATAIQEHDDSAGASIPQGGGTRDLIADLEDTVVTTGDTTGLATGGPNDFTNVITQSFAIRALQNAGSALTDEAVSYLLLQQCADGSFRETMSPIQCTTGTGTVDYTAFAVQALDATAAHVDDVDRAVDWLASQQQADGSFLNDGVGSTNSTGLASRALAAHGQPVAAEKAADWILGRQVKSGDEEGAIAKDTASSTAAGTSPIARVDRDSFVRATVQAAPALVVLEKADLTVTAPAGYVQAAASITVSATGLKPGEPFTADAGGASVTGTASGAGVATATVVPPAGTATRTVTIRGTNALRIGTATIKVLGAKTLKPTLKSSSVSKGGRQTVTVTGLAAGETVNVYLSNQRVATSAAYSNGSRSVSFPVGRSAGKKTVKVTGQFTNRTGSTTFTVK